MQENKADKIKQNMLDIYSQIESRQKSDTKVNNITYYKEFEFTSVRING